MRMMKMSRMRIRRMADSNCGNLSVVVAIKETCVNLWLPRNVVIFYSLSLSIGMDVHAHAHHHVWTHVSANDGRAWHPSRWRRSVYVNWRAR